MQRQLVLPLAVAVLAACHDGAQPVAPVADVVGDVSNAADLSYLWVPLETRGENFESSARAINNAGQVVGSASTAERTPCSPGVPCPPAPPSHAALWENGVMRDLGTLGGERSEATQINERGEVVGWSSVADGSTHAFFWDNGTMQDLGPVALFPRGIFWGRVLWSPVHINDRGQVIGNTPEGGAFLWEDGVMQALPLAFVTDINNQGQAAGWVMRADAGGVLRAIAALWEDGVVTELGTLGGESSSAFAISNSGWVAGSSRTEPRPFMGGMIALTLPFRWRNGLMEDLGRPGNESIWPVLPFVGNRGQVVVTDPAVCLTEVWDHGAWQGLTGFGGCSWAQAMNGQGAITGAARSFSGGPAFVWKDGVSYDLGMGLGRASRGQAINDPGVVAGYTGSSPFGTAWHPQAAIWVPVPDVVALVP